MSRNWTSVWSTWSKRLWWYVRKIKALLSRWLSAGLHRELQLVISCHKLTLNKEIKTVNEWVTESVGFHALRALMSEINPDSLNRLKWPFLCEWERERGMLFVPASVRDAVLSGPVISCRARVGCEVGVVHTLVLLFSVHQTVVFRGIGQQCGHVTEKASVCDWGAWGEEPQCCSGVWEDCCAALGKCRFGQYSWSSQRRWTAPSSVGSGSSKSTP